MSKQEPIRVVVEKKGGCLSGCGTTLAVMVALGLTIQYWYVALPIVAIVVFVATVGASPLARGPFDASAFHINIAEGSH